MATRKTTAKKKPARKAPAKRGRPSKYTEALVDEICRRMMDDGRSLRAICSEDADMPDRGTVRRWLSEKPDFVAKYAHAREEQAEFHHDKMQEFEDGVLTGTLKPDAARVLLDSKRWRMEKLKPKVYGKSMTLEGNPDAPIQIIRKTYAGD